MQCMAPVMSRFLNRLYSLTFNITHRIRLSQRSSIVWAMHSCFFRTQFPMVSVFQDELVTILPLYLYENILECSISLVEACWTTKKITELVVPHWLTGRSFGRLGASTSLPAAAVGITPWSLVTLHDHRVWPTNLEMTWPYMTIIWCVLVSHIGYSTIMVDGSTVLLDVCGLFGNNLVSGEHPKKNHSTIASGWKPWWTTRFSLSNWDHHLALSSQHFSYVPWEFAQLLSEHVLDFSGHFKWPGVPGGIQKKSLFSGDPGASHFTSSDKSWTTCVTWKASVRTRGMTRKRSQCSSPPERVIGK